MKSCKVSQKRCTILFMLMIGIVMGILCSIPAQAQNDLCVSDIGGLAGLPTIDGIVDDDSGWNGATRVNLSADLGVTKSAVFQIGRPGGVVVEKPGNKTSDYWNIYISFIVYAPAPGTDNTIVLGLSTDGNPANDWRIHIQPFINEIVDGTNQVPSVVYWRNSATWNNEAATGTEAVTGFWLKDNIRFSKTSSYWAIEIKIPWENNIANAGSNNKIYFPTGANTFKFYANVLSTSTLLGTYTQDPWPSGILIIPLTSTNLTQCTPIPALWGTLSLFPRPECDGVSLLGENIGVKDPDNPSVITSQIRSYNPPGGFPETDIPQCNTLPDSYLWPGTQGPTNIFVAKPYNGMAGSKSVKAEFRQANWGIPGPYSWSPIGDVAGGLTITPPTTSYSTPEVTINAGNFGDLTTNWNLSYKQSCIYSYSPHQCIQVNLDSSDPYIVFLNKSVQRNMDFVEASTFKRDAEISAKGYGAPPVGRSQHEFLITVDTETVRPVKQYSDSVKNARYDAIDKKYKAMNWIARGYIKTGQYLIINNRQYEYAKAVGGFGYIAQHFGNLKNWRSNFQGAALKSFKDGNYTINIPPDEVAKVTTTIKAINFSPFAIILRGGIAIPQGTNSSLLDPGLSFHLGLEYLFNNVFSIEAIFGYHQFKYMSPGNKLKTYQFSLNGRLYFVKSSLRPFINTGVGIYKFNPGDTKFGYNGGAGLQYALSTQFALEAVYNYHIVNTEIVNFKFSAIQGGFRYRF